MTVLAADRIHGQECIRTSDAVLTQDEVVDIDIAYDIVRHGVGEGRDVDAAIRPVAGKGAGQHDVVYDIYELLSTLEERHEKEYAEQFIQI